MEPQKTRKRQINPEKEQSWKHHTSWFQNILQSFSHQSSVALYKGRHIDQWYRSEGPKIKPYICGQLIFDKGTKSTRWRKDCFFNTWSWENWISMCKKMKLEPYLTPLTKISLKWINNLNVRPETIRRHKEKFPWHCSQQSFFGYDTKNTGNKSKNRQVRLYCSTTLYL